MRVIGIILIVIFALIFLFGCCPYCQYDDAFLDNDRAWLRTESLNNQLLFQTNNQNINATLERMNNGE